MNKYEKLRQKPGYNEWQKDYDNVCEKSTPALLSFFRNILIVSSSVFGILISLHDTTAQSQCIRQVFLLGILLLSLGILSAAIVLYDLSTIDERLRIKLLKEEFDNVCDGKGYKPENVKVGNRNISRFFQKCSVFSLLLSLIVFTTYIVLITFN